ncbi:MAG: SAM-dependent methyltransferase, partial [Mycolicibacter algericus]
SAWIAEGVLVYLPGDAQEQLFTGIDGLAAPGSHLAVEDGTPLPDEVFQAAVQAEVVAGDDSRVFHQLIYNERCAPADQWFGERGWTAVATPLADYLRELGRPVPGPDSEAGPMVARNSLVRAVKR